MEIYETTDMLNVRGARFVGQSTMHAAVLDTSKFCDC